MEQIVQSLLRTYPGIFDYPNPIRLGVLSKKTGNSEKNIQSQLEKIAKDNMCDFELKHAYTSINFLIPREDEKTINVIARAIESYNKIKEDQLQYVIDYCINDKLCKSVQLLRYFDQDKVEDCGICSVCTQKQRS